MAKKRTKTTTKKPAAAKPKASTATKTTRSTASKSAAQKKKVAAPVTEEAAVASPVQAEEQQALQTAAAAPVVREEAPAPQVRKEAEAPVLKEEAPAPQVREEAEAPAVKEEAPAPQVREEAEAPAVSEADNAPEEAPAAQEAQEPAPEGADAPAAAQSNAPAQEPQSDIKEAKAAVKPKIALTPKSDGSKLTPVVARPITAGNPYRPMEATVLEVIQETPNIKTIRVTLDDPEKARNFTYEPGQVGQLSVFGAGESTFVINSPPSQKDYLQFSVMLTGEVTQAIHNLCKGDKVGVRAPLGRPFPYELWKGKNIFFIGGGIGMAPIRTIMLHVLEHKEDYGTISLLYGGRSPQDMAYSYELKDWMERPDLDCTLTIDREAEGWPHKVGLIPNVLRELNPSPDNCIAVLCGPPIMIKFTLQALDELKFPHENVYTTLEKRMKCGIGICGRCGIGGKYVCLDGPVFSQKELDELPPEL